MIDFAPIQCEESVSPHNFNQESNHSLDAECTCRIDEDEKSVHQEAALRDVKSLPASISENVT